MKYGEYWEQNGDRNMYKLFYSRQPNIHSYFNKWVDSIRPKSVLEVGCGDGIYSRSTFKNLNEYTGIDISRLAISEAQGQSVNMNHKFISGDFIKIDYNKKSDLVFSHSVIDHVYDINRFVEKALGLTNQYLYITAYNGFWPSLDKHEYREESTGTCYLNRVSTKELKSLFPQLTFNTFVDRGTPVTVIKNKDDCPI